MDNFFEQLDLKTIITIFAGFGAASTAQLFSHHFSRKREDIKYHKESLQNLYSPVIFEIENYIIGEFVHARNIEIKPLELLWLQSKNPKKIFRMILEKIGSNLQYAKPELIMDYFNLTNKEPDTIYKKRIDKEIALCNTLLLDYVQLCKKLKINSYKVDKYIQGPLMFTQLYELLGHTDHFKAQELLIKHYFEIRGLGYVYFKKIIRLNHQFKKNFTIDNYYNAKNKSNELYTQIGQKLGSKSDWWFSAISNPYGYPDDIS